MADIGTLTATLGADIKNFEKNVNRAEDMMRGYEKTTNKELKQAETHFNKFGMSIGKVVGTLGGLVAGAASLYALQQAISSVITTGVEFEQQMVNVGAVMRLDKTTSEGLANFEKLEAAAREMGETTEWSASKSAEALQFMAMAGWDTNQAVGALPGMLDLATAGMTDLATVSDIVTDQMTAFHMGVEETGRFTDALIGTTTRANTNITMMGESLKYVGPVAYSAGQDIEATAAQIGILANSGIKATQAGTSLRQIMVRLPKIMAALNAELGTNLTPGVSTLAEVFEKVEEAGWDTTKMTDEFGMIAVTSAQILKGNVEQLNELEGALRNNTGETRKLADEMRSSLGAAFKELQSTIEGLSLDIFDQYKDTIMETVKGITGYIRDNKAALLEFTGNLKTTIEGVISFMGSLAQVAMDTFNAIADASKNLGEWSTGHLSVEVDEVAFEEAKQRFADIQNQKIEAEVTAIVDDAKEGLEEVNSYVSYLSDEEFKNISIGVDADVASAEKKLIDLDAKINELKEGKDRLIEIQASGKDVTKELAILDERIAELTGEKKKVEVELGLDSGSVEKTKQEFETLSVFLEDGTEISIQVPIDQNSKEKTKKELEELVPPDKRLEMQIELDIAQIEANAEKFKAQMEAVQTSVEWKAKLDIAEVEANAEIVTSAFDSISETISSTGDVLSGLFGMFGQDLDFRETWALFDQIEIENELRKKAVELQEKLTTKQIEVMDTWLQLKKENKPMKLQVQADGLQPHLENILYELLRYLQDQMYLEGGDVLVPIASAT